MSTCTHILVISGVVSLASRLPIYVNHCESEFMTVAGTAFCFPEFHSGVARHFEHGEMENPCTLFRRISVQNPYSKSLGFCTSIMQLPWDEPFTILYNCREVSCDIGLCHLRVPLDGC